jgi:hypothetical protein
MALTALSGSIFNWTLFVIITVLYYSFKQNPTLENVNSPEIASSQNKQTIIYFLIVLLTQFAFNARVLSSMCGDAAVSRNVMAQAAFYTIIPWTFFFGIVILVLYVFPSFKSAFSDVVGYFYVSSSANDLLVTLLKNQGSDEITKRVFAKTDNEGKGIDFTVSDKVSFSDKNPDFAAGLGKQIFKFNKPATEMNFGANIQHTIKLLQKKLNLNEAKGAEELLGDKSKEITDANANDLILKICGNSGILINQMLPSNFESYWNTLSSLFKDEYKNTEDGNILKQKLFNLVVTRDNVGESMWFIYTGILVSSIVQFQIATFSCKK